MSHSSACSWLFNTSTRLRITFSVPSGPRSSQLCRFELDEDPDFAEWVEQLAHTLYRSRQATLAPPAVDVAESVQELIDVADEATAQTLAELGVLRRAPGEQRWGWRADVTLLLTTTAREAGEPLCEAHWPLPYIARILTWVRARRASAPGEAASVDETLEQKLQRAKLLVRDVPPEVAFERCFDSDRSPPQGPWLLHRHYQLEGATLWVEEPATSIRLPVHVASAEQAPLAAALRGEQPLEALPAPLLAKLWQAGLLQQARSAREHSWKAAARTAARQLTGLGQATLRGILDTHELLRWRKYCSDLYQAGYFPPMLTTANGPLRSILYAEPAIRLLHEPLAQLLGEIAGEPLEPSYCILARYFEGATLPRHTDRPQCVWNFSLVLHWESQTAAPSPWPFFVEGPGGVVSQVLLRPGDGVLYRGTEAPHWRDALPPGNATTVAFFHFVPPHFQGHRS